MLKRLLFSSILTGALSACGPTYQTFYDFRPIDSSNGRECANHCLGMRQDCQSEQHQLKESCESRSEAAYESCMSNQVFKYNPDTGKSKCVYNCYCSQDSCDEDLESCEQ